MYTCTYIHTYHMWHYSELCKCSDETNYLLCVCTCTYNAHIHTRNCVHTLFTPSEVPTILRFGPTVYVKVKIESVLRIGSCKCYG